MKRLLLILLITPFLFGNTAFATKVQFFQGSFVSAKQKAATEGKLIFVDFTARWCLPCQMMDETTFNDELLADYLAASFVSVKVDIDDFDGFALKEEYEIQALPSILIFNAAGELLDRHQEAMTATKMKELLVRYDHPDNKKIAPITHTKPSSTINTVPSYEPATVPTYEPAPAPTYESAPAPTYEAEPAPTYEAPAPTYGTTPTYESTPAPTYPSTNAPSRPALEATTPAPYTSSPETTRPAPVEATIPTYEPTPAPIIRESVPVIAPEVMPVGEGLFRFTVSRQPSAGFSVQTGAFGHYGNVLVEVEKLQAKVDEPVLVNIGQLRGKTVYKVMIGEFMNRQDAADFSNYLKGIQIDGIIKDLTLMK